MTNVRYFSTKGTGATTVSFEEALMRGQPGDKGLYVPTMIPKLLSNMVDEISKMKGASYPAIAYTVLKSYFEGLVPDYEFRKMLATAYQFEIPFEYVGNNVFVMRLDQGPTASFKDFAAQFLAQIMAYYARKSGKHIILLVSTSGDTGSAIAKAFHGIEGIDVVVFFPIDEVTIIQRKLMTTLGGNITAVAVHGKFDDCQALHKTALADPELAPLNLSSANSINIGRLLPQMVYYFYAHSIVADGIEPIVFSVPCGNFDNLAGGIMAHKMGLPVRKFVVGVNANDEFPNFLNTERYPPIQPSRNCISNAMNVGHPNNLARIVHFYGGKMDEKGDILEKPDFKSMRRDIFSESISDDRTRETIRNAFAKQKLLLEPHGAVAYAALGDWLERHKKEKPVCVSLETAHPAKFPEEIKNVLGIDPELPPSMKGLADKREEMTKIEPTYKAFKSFLVNKFR